MKPVYPFSAIVGQQEMKLALLLAAVDWRISVLLRGDKGAGKTTAARALATLLPHPSPFINLPIGATEDRLLGGLHLERALKGDPALKAGLLSEAHGGVLYVDEINLLPAHLGDALLDTASSGVNVIEREGHSASHAAEFVLLGSMNSEEGILRPQLLDRFALAVDIAATLDASMRQTVVERRLAFDRDPNRFHEENAAAEQQLRQQIVNARTRKDIVLCPNDILACISSAVCDAGVRSLRADLAAVRASIAYAAWLDSDTVTPEHVATILPLVLAHRSTHRNRPPTPQPQPPAPQPNEQQSSSSNDHPQSKAGETLARIFAPKDMQTFALQPVFDAASNRGTSAHTPNPQPGPIVRARRTETPGEIDLHATLNHAVLQTGKAQPTASDLHERIRSSITGTRYLFVIDSSGSHAPQERMRLVKGAVSSLLTQSFKTGDEVALIAFRGAAAQVLLAPSRSLAEATAALEYLPTGGRTPLAHALDLARTLLTPATVLILLTDGRANVALGSGDPWQQALGIAARIHTPALVIDTESTTERLARSRHLAHTLAAEYIHLENPALNNTTLLTLRPPPLTSRPNS